MIDHPVAIVPLIVFFLLGTILASFIGVVVERLNTGEPIMKGRSRCDACGRQLTAFDLVPILSYFSHGGRSRCCGVRLSFLAPLTEIGLGALYALSYLKLGLVAALPVLLILLALLLILVLYDLKHMILPILPLIAFVVMSVLFAWFTGSTTSSFLPILFGACIIGAILLAIYLVSRGRAMGLADAPLAFGLALVAGSGAIAGFAYSFWIGAVIGIGLLLARPAGSRMGVEVPFAPFLALGFLLAYFTAWDPFSALFLLSTRL